MAADLGQPPRRLPHWESRALRFGHPATLFGALALTVAASLFWLFVAAYGLSFSALATLVQPRLELPATAGETIAGQLWTGETVSATMASFEHEGVDYRLASFAVVPPPAPGKPVTVIVPVSSPEHGWIAGGQKYPLRLLDLFKVALVTSLPGLGLTLWGLLAGARQRGLMRDGLAVMARRTSHHGLARPFSDYFLDRFQVTDAGGKSHHFWSVGDEVPEQTRVLIAHRGWKGAVVVDRLLPRLSVLQGSIHGTGRARRASAWAVLILWSGQLAVLLLFLFT